MLPPEALPELIAEDHIWLRKLKEEFYFSNQEAKNLKEMMKSSYEDAYLFCLNDTFEDFNSIFLYTFSWNYDKGKTAIKSDNISNNRPLIWLQLCHINPRLNLIKLNMIQELTCNHLRGRYWLNNVWYKFDELVSAVNGDIPKALEILFTNRNNLQKIASIIHQIGIENLTNFDEEIQKIRLIDTDKLRLVTDDNLQHLNYFHIFTLLNLYDLGLRSSMIRGESWFNSRVYYKAIENLIVQQRLEPISAIATLHDLERFQVYGLSEGLTLEDVKQLKSYNQVEILSQFKQKGFTVEHVLKIEIELIGNLKVLPILLNYVNIIEALNILITLKNEIDDVHCNVLNKFLEKGMKIDQAIKLIMNMNNQQALCIDHGIDYAEVINLNEVQAMTLRYLYPNGLRGIHLRNKDWFNCPYHKDVLVYMVRKMNFSITNAFEVINNTSWLQILKIMKDLIRLDLTELNHYQIMALLKLDQSGLRKEHLIGWVWFNSIMHKDYLVYCINVEKMHVADALRLLHENYTMDEAHKFIDIRI